MCTFDIDPDIRRAHTPPGALYHDAEWFAALVERVHTRTWHGIPIGELPSAPEAMIPWMLLPGCVDEPVLLTRADDGALHLLSNVCTHRGNVLVLRACAGKSIRCAYHGRRFALDGRMLSMPEFEQALDFPRQADDLPRLAVERWGPLAFTSLSPALAFEELVEPMRERLAFLPLDRARFDAAASRDYHVEANWALYCDNYLEGFHIPFVHPALNRALDYDAYETLLLPHGSLQIGIAQKDDVAFTLPEDHVDHGKRVAAYYLHLFPTTMINAYPWGLSVNYVQPLSPTSSRVVYLSFVWDESKRGQGAGTGLEQVEFEDERIVERTARGVRARLYDRGRYSPTREQAVHHFHRLLAQALK
jgi:choline monooxygenase